MSNVVVISKELKKEYLSALWSSTDLGHTLALRRFKEEHPEELKIILTMSRKRHSLEDSLECLKLLNEPIYWFTLTFNDFKDGNTIETKRKSAQRFLHNISMAYVMVEEYGDLNERYHLHGFLCFKYGRGFIDFKEWHSRQKLIEISEDKRFKARIRYLTNYTAKSVPRIRRDKVLCGLYNTYKRYKKMKIGFPSVFKEAYSKAVAKYVNPF